MDTPLVSICSITYNHAPYIRQCLDGFLMQKTKFKYEIIIHDDASTDGTAEIIKEYVEKYPNLITPIFQKENQYSKGVRGMFPRYCFPRAKGKYIALCEGDDYWTDPLKLQKQVDFLEANPDFVMCSHLCDFVDQETGNKLFSYPDFGNNESTVLRLGNFVRGGEITQTATLFFRNLKKIVSTINACNKSADIVLYYILLMYGPGFCIPEVMSIYRIHNEGVWTKLSMNKRIVWEFEMKLSICEFDKSEKSALFLLLQFQRLIPRKLILKKWKMFTKVFQIFIRHFGLQFTLKLIIDKLFFNKKLANNHPLLIK